MNVTHNRVDTPKGTIDIYRLENNSGASVVLSSLGAGIVEVNVPDAHNTIGNVALGYADIESYFYDGPCMGKTPGRYANRIGAGKFTIDGKEYNLAINNGPNHLHGGPDGFQNRIWDSKVDGDKVVFTRVSPDGEEGYPGNLTVIVEYSWSEDNVLTVHYRATTDAPTVVNLTNHSYWNLNAENAGNAMRHYLHLNAEYYLPTDENLCPTGEIAPVASTPMDFTTKHRVSDDIGKDFPALKYGKGYDNCWLINKYKKGELQLAATMMCAYTGRVLDIYTTQPAVQVYTGNWLKGSPKGRSGQEYDDYDGRAIECQGCPDAPNKPEFPSQLLRPGEVYEETIVFDFRTEGDF